MNNDSEKRISSKSPSVSVVKLRKLAELQELNPLLTDEEVNNIFIIYQNAITRLFMENEINDK